MADIASLGLYIDSSGVIRATKELRTLHGQTEKNEESTNKLSRSYVGLKSALAAVGFVAITKQIIGQINEYTALTNKLKLVTSGSKNLADVQESLFNIAQKTRGSLEGTTDLYFRLAKSTSELGISQERLASVTETVNQAVAVSGTTAQAATAALFQMGQGLAAGALRGQELNSVMEQTPRVAQAIADGMGVPIGKLREMAEQGLITSEVVISAFESQAEKISGEFDSTTKTVQQALQQIENTALKTFGSLDASELTGAMDEFRRVISDPEVVASLQSIAAGLVSITSAAIEGVAWLGKYGAAIGRDLAGGLPNLDETNDKINTITETLAKLKEKQSAALAEAPSFFAFLFNDATEIDGTIKGLELRLAELQAQRDSMITEDAETPETATTMTGTGLSPEAAAEAIAMRAEAQREAEWEATANAVFDATEREEILTEIARESADQRKKIAEDESNAKKAVMEGMFSNLVSLMNSGSKKMFNIGKVAAIASGLVSMYESVTSSYAAGAKVGGPILGAAYAATAAIAQAANLAKIKSASFGGGGGAATVSSTTGGQPVTGQLQFEPPSQTQAAAAPTVQELRVVVEGDSPNSEAMRKLAEDLAETIKNMGGVGRLVVS